MPIKMEITEETEEIKGCRTGWYFSDEGVLFYYDEDAPEHTVYFYPSGNLYAGYAMDCELDEARKLEDSQVDIDIRIRL